MIGYDEETLQSLTFQEITHPDDLDEDLELLHETLAGTRTSYRLVKRYLHADGHVVWGDLSVALLREADGTPIHFISQILDVTEQFEYRSNAWRSRRPPSTTSAGSPRRSTTAVDVGLVLIDADGPVRADEPAPPRLHVAGLPRRPRRAGRPAR